MFPRYSDLKPEDFPRVESLETTIARAVPYLEEEILPRVRKGDRVIIVAHGTSLRGLVKVLGDYSNEEVNFSSRLEQYQQSDNFFQIMKINLPNGFPFYFEFDDDFKVVTKLKVNTLYLYQS